VGRQKADDTPVSDADLAVDKMLRERLTGERPDYGWLSEESIDHPSRLDAARVWIVDPIDGTRAFLAGSRCLPPYSTQRRTRCLPRGAEMALTSMARGSPSPRRKRSQAAA